MVQDHHLEDAILDRQLAGFAMQFLIKAPVIVLVEADGQAVYLRSGVQKDWIEQRRGGMMNLQQVAPHTSTAGALQQAFGETLECRLVR
jgi:hypothetical protein